MTITIKDSGNNRSRKVCEIDDPITSSTAANIMEGGESLVRYYAAKGEIRFHRMPSGLRLYEREDCERIGKQRRERRKGSV